MGSVWRGAHVVTGRKIAVKILDEKFLSNPSVVQRFGREARAASAIAHEGIVEVLDLDQTEDGIPFLVMEFLEGRSLADRIDHGQPMTEPEMVGFGAQLLDALHAAHESGVIHRDLKPDNIYLVPGRRGETVKILDFGISWKSDEQDAKLTVTGSVLGTPHYMSPEQAMGELDTDRRVDIYAAGVVLYECVVGAVPFEGANYNKLLRVILDEEPVPPSRRGARISPPVEAVILKALSKRKVDRPATAQEMRSMLLRASRGEPVVAVPKAGPTEDSVAARWLGAELEIAPRSRPEASLRRDPPSRPDVALPRDRDPISRPDVVLPRGRDPISRSDIALPERQSVPSARLTTPEFLLDGPGPNAIEIDASALERRSAPLAHPSVEVAGPSNGAWSTTGRFNRSSNAHLSAGPSEPARVSPHPSASETTAAQPEEARPTSIARTVVLGLVGVCTTGVVAFAVRSYITGSSRTLSTPSPPAVTAVAGDEVEVRPAAKQPPPPAFVEVTVLLEPQDVEARMRLDGIPGATSPIRVRRGTRHVLEVSAPGFRDERVEFTAERDQRLRITLRRP